MNTILSKEDDQETGQGIQDLADDIEDLLAYSANPQRYQDIRNHFEEDEKYFEEDLDSIKKALNHLEEQDRIKSYDVRLDVEERNNAYSIKDYDSI